jgi:hypothetical protein
MNRIERRILSQNLPLRLILFFFLGASCWIIGWNLFAIKLSELLALALIPFHLQRSINVRYRSLWLLLFSIILFSFMTSICYTEYYPLNSELRYQPVLFNILRFIRISLCISVAVFATADEVRIAVRGFVWTGGLLSMLSLILFFTTSTVSDGSLLRMLGSTESGPGGVLAAFAVILLIAFEGARGIVFALPLLLALLLSRSSSGYLILCVWLVFKLVCSQRIKITYRLAGLAMAFVVSIYSYPDIETKVWRYSVQYINYGVEHPEIARYLGGRHGLVSVAPQMLAASPVLGVGFGNYMNVRNTPEYLGSWPATVLQWDDLGCDLATVLVENGVLGFLLATVVWCLYFRSARDKALMMALLAALATQSPLVFVWWWLFVRHAQDHGLLQIRPKQSSVGV